MQWCRIYFVCPDELTLDNIDDRAVVIYDDRVNLLVIWTISNIIFRLVWVSQMNISQIPCNESFTVILEILLIILLYNFFLNLVIQSLTQPSMYSNVLGFVAFYILSFSSYDLRELLPCESCLAPPNLIDDLLYFVFVYANSSSPLLSFLIIAHMSGI